MTARFDASTQLAAVLCLLPLLVTSSSAAVVLVSTSGDPPRALPHFGLGNEFLFQTSTDAGLNAALVASGSRIARYPGGTPADYFSSALGWLDTPTGPGCGGCDSIPWRPTPPDALQAYLTATAQASVLVINQLTQNLSTALASLDLFAASGNPLAFLELGNEMYDATRADVLAAYPQPVDYGVKMAAWTAAIRSAHPSAAIAWVGLANDWDNRTRAWNAAVMPLALAAGATAATVHLYPGLPALNLSAPAAYPKLLSGLFPALAGYAAYTARTIPADLRLWVTEWGTWGCADAENTWLQALYHTALVAQLPFALPRVDVVLPYCAVCGDPNMPSFTTAQYGPIVPPNTSVDASAWLRTASGHGYALAFAATGAAGARAIQALDFTPNAVLDPAVPASRVLVGLRAAAADGTTRSLVLLNLGADAAELDVSAAALALPCAAPDTCASVYWPATLADAARQNIRVEELAHTEGPLAGGALTLPAYAIAVVACTCVR